MEDFDYKDGYHRLCSEVCRLQREDRGAYKREFIEIKKALSTLKRSKKPTDAELEVLGCSINEFNTVGEYIINNEFEVKEMALFIKRLNDMGVDLYEAGSLKEKLNSVRRTLESNPDDPVAIAKEAILGNILFNRSLD